jgi:transcriptional regulator with XRE-family HTH domain
VSAADTHGTRSCFVQRKCRCELCRAANRKYASERARVNWTDRFEHQWTTPDKALAHLDMLRHGGMGLRQIQLSTGIARSTLQQLAGRKRISRATEASVLAVRPAVAAGARVDATGTTRRLRALMAIGWSGKQLGDRLGVTTANLWPLLRGREHVHAATARKVADLYDELWDQPGNRKKSINLAQRRGWALPLAWDDDEIDDPAAMPHLDTRTDGVQVPLDVLLEDFQHTRREHGGNTRLAAERLGVSRDALERALHRARAAGVEVNFFHDRRTA